MSIDPRSDYAAVLGDVIRSAESDGLAVRAVVVEFLRSCDDAMLFDLDGLVENERRRREGVKRREREAAGIEAHRSAEPWMEPLARRLWGDTWRWIVHDDPYGAHLPVRLEIGANGPVRYFGVTLRAELRFSDSSSGPPMISGGWPDYWSLAAWDDRFPSGREAHTQPDWTSVQADYLRAEAAERLESRYRAHLANAVYLLPAERRREARSIQERRATVTHFAGLLGQARA